LPIAWLSFTVMKSGKHVAELKWSTTDEVNDHHYEVERSVNGINFSIIATVSANGSQEYQYFDVTPLNGISYYRIKQVNKNGKYSYSPIEMINFDSKILWQVYPNPVGNKNTMLYAYANLDKVQILLTDISGKKLYRNILNTVRAGQQILIPLQSLSWGVYLLKVASNEYSKTVKLIVQ